MSTTGRRHKCRHEIMHHNTCMAWHTEGHLCCNAVLLGCCAGTIGVGLAWQQKIQASRWDLRADANLPHPSMQAAAHLIAAMLLTCLTCQGATCAHPPIEEAGRSLRGHSPSAFPRDAAAPCRFSLDSPAI